jgi:mitochondrial enoyl-[acyl-carrier protein] reductase / trans-2-enoyl-CoA reductase
VLVTYGGMSLQPVCLPTSLLIFKDISSRGFWLSNPAKEGGPQGRLQVIDAVARMYQEGALRPNRCARVALCCWLPMVLAR